MGDSDDNEFELEPDGKIWDDVERYAVVIATNLGFPVEREVTGRHQMAAEAVLKALMDEGRLLPPGGVTITQYGADVTTWRGERRGIALVGGDEFAKRYSTYRRYSTTWAQAGPNDDWARYVTAWEEKSGMSES